MKILMLGGGNCQVNAIKKLKESGHTIVVSDYYEDCIGKKICDYKELVSTFDVKANILVARKYSVDGVITLGTDQPVYTAARISDELGLSFPISSDTAKNVTNKKNMKKIFDIHSIPSQKYKLLNSTFLKEDLIDLSFPLVTKPVDSQGQRGVFIVENYQELKYRFNEVLEFSKEEEIIVEEYYPSDEITVNGWVLNGVFYLISVVDRIRYHNPPSLGICIAHIFPSIYLNKYHKDIMEISNQIVVAFEIENGPVYFQFLIGDKGIMVNEIACRIGGAYEDISIPMITGIDILKLLINTVLGKEININPLKEYDILNVNKYFTTQLFFINNGIIKNMTSINEIEKNNGVHKMNYNIQVGDKMMDITNATQRAGYFILEGNNYIDLNHKINTIFDNIVVMDEKGNNLILKYKDYSNKYNYYI